MKKALYAFLICGLVFSSSLLVAKTGILVHEKDGTTTFYPAEELDFVEFTQDYEPEEPVIPEDPSQDPGNMDPEPEIPDNQEPGNPGNTENPGDNEGSEGSDNQGNEQNPGDSGNQGNTDKPGDSGNQGNTDKPGDSGNSGEEQKPDNSEDQGNQENPGEGEGEGGNSENEDPVNPEPVELAFHYFTDKNIQLNQTYLIVGPQVCAAPVETSKEYGYLPATNVSISNNTIKDNLENGFEFVTDVSINGENISVENGKFLIKDSNGRYLYLKDSYTSFNLSSTPELNSNKTISEGFLFSASKNSDNTWSITNKRDNDIKYITYSTKYSNFAAYSNVSSSDSYPSLYILSEGPVTPGNDGNTNQGDQGGSGDTENPGVGTAPDQFKFPFSYVVLPEGTPQQVKEYTGYTLNFNKDNHTPNYAAWELLSSETSGSNSNASYWVDKDIEGCLSTDFAYSTTKYERGHMCPKADNKWSSAAMKDCMSMANMCPQLSQLNGGIWATLEGKCRDWAKKYGAVWIICGPLYSATDTSYIGEAKARVASAYFKAVMYYDGDNSKAIGFIFQNGSNPGNFMDYSMTIDQLEVETGFDFFSTLPDDLETKMESTVEKSFWQ